uniref:Immunoglobulin domain-containing protein n=1 Tax=Sinocyclocheilus grahami TaxID=75366 RepID=A0A672PJR1_SINGR
MFFFLMMNNYIFVFPGVFGEDVVTVMEGDTVTLHTDINKKEHDKMLWYFEDTRIALINGHPNTSCLYDGEGGRFRDSLKVDYKTGSLIITDITTEHAGRYEAEIIRSESSGKRQSLNRNRKCDSRKITRRISISHDDTIKTFNVSAAERDTMKRKSVKEGESVTLDPGVIKQPNHVMTWYFNDTLIAEITGDPNKTCTDFHCPERFRNRLQLDHQTGSLTIMNIRITDSGVYELKISSSSRRRRRSISHVKSFDVIVISKPILLVHSFSLSFIPDSGLSPGAVAGLSVIVLLLVAAAVAVGVIFYRRRSARNDKYCLLILQ